MLAVPMWILFELGIVAGKMARKRKHEQETEEEHAT